VTKHIAESKQKQPKRQVICIVYFEIQYSCPCTATSDIK